MNRLSFKWRKTTNNNNDRVCNYHLSNFCFRNNLRTWHARNALHFSAVPTYFEYKEPMVQSFTEIRVYSIITLTCSSCAPCPLTRTCLREKTSFTIKTNDNSQARVWRYLSGWCFPFCTQVDSNIAHGLYENDEKFTVTRKKVVLTVGLSFSEYSGQL